VPSRVAQVSLTIETRGRDHAREILDQLVAAGYTVTVASPAL